MEFALLWHGGQGWFLSFHVFTRYVKVAFFNARPCSLPRPVLPNRRTRAISTSMRMTSSTNPAGEMVKQAAKLPGWGAKP